MKREIPILITLLTGVFCLIGFFVPHPWIRNGYEDLQNWALVLVGLTYVLGVANLLRVNVDAIQHRHRDWLYKVVLVAGLFVMIGIGFADGDRFLDASSNFSWMYRTFYTPMSATMFSLLAFFIASAAFRAFRIRSTEALLLAIAAFVLMIGRVPIGNAISHYIPDAADWLMEIPQNAAKRGILIGAALGVMATGIRLILGIEKTYGSGEGGG
jgi:cytochrome bd-type quinol oxidase subunit 2